MHVVVLLVAAAQHLQIAHQHAHAADAHGHVLATSSPLWYQSGTQVARRRRAVQPFPWSANTSAPTCDNTTARVKKSIIIGIDGFAGMLAKSIVEDEARFPQSTLRELVRAGALYVFEGEPTQPPTSSGQSTTGY